MHARLIAKLKRETGISWVKDGSEWNGGSEVLWSGEGATIPNGEGEAVNAFDYYGPESIYEFGVHKTLVAWAEKNGVYWECHDPGTYHAYKV